MESVCLLLVVLCDLAEVVDKDELAEGLVTGVKEGALVGGLEASPQDILVGGGGGDSDGNSSCKGSESSEKDDFLEKGEEREM